MKECVLFVDDDEETLQSLLRSLGRNGFSTPVEIALNAEDALRIAGLSAPAVAVVDLELEKKQGPEGGLKLIHDLLLRLNTVRIIVLTGHGEERYGIEALKRGAVSFIAKPAETVHLQALMEDGLNYARLRNRIKKLEEEISGSLPQVGLSSKNPAMKKVLEEVRFAATTSQPVLIIGETGVGKGIVAQAIHELSRKNKPFVRAQPTYGSFDLIQSELFGHEKGSFTGAVAERRGLIEEANSGTLFLDEIDSLPPETQVMLLNVIQERKFRRVGSMKDRTSDFRLVAATNKSLDELREKIRADLFHRIAYLVLSVPPLRDRREDIDSISLTLLLQLSSQERLGVTRISPEARARIMAYDWPGNVRELCAVIEQAAFRARYVGRSTIEPEDIYLDSTSEQVVNYKNKGDFRSQVDSYEQSLIKQALRDSNQNLSETARRLGVDRTQLKRMLKRHNIRNGI